ncbi:unnamed protein product, partial [Rotaria magnacalcarata]
MGKNSISFNDIKDELKTKYNSLFLIEEIIDTINERNRYLRIELLDKKKEYNAMLNSGKISIIGQLYDIDEFLPSPKLLICSKWNQSGHVKYYCKSSNFDICRPCGNDRNNNDNHKECKILGVGLSSINAKKTPHPHPAVCGRLRLYWVVVTHELSIPEEISLEDSTCSN